MPGGADRTHRNRISVIRSAGLPERIPHLETAPPAPSAFAVTRRTPRRYGKRHLAHSQSDEFVSACPGKQHSVRHAHACGLCSLRHIPRDRVLRAPPVHGGPVFRIAHPSLARPGFARHTRRFCAAVRSVAGRVSHHPPVPCGAGFSTVRAHPARARVLHLRAHRGPAGFSPLPPHRGRRRFPEARTSARAGFCGARTSVRAG